ncbi:MAG: hypothetical protein WBB31_08010 [Saprospiraceae bacterium]
MKTTITIYLITVFLICILTSCTNPENNKTSEKELGLQKRELDLKQKELDFKEKELKEKEETDIKKNELKENEIQAPKPTKLNNINSELNMPIAKVPLTKAADVRKVHPNCNEANTPHAEGNTPLMDMYCGVLGQKPIEIYITSQNISTNIVSGYSVVGNSRTNFEGKYTSRIKKGSNRKDVLDFDETIYTLILGEPTTTNKNGVFKLDLHINDTWRNGEGIWTSYDGMLYREIVIYDRLNPDF